MDFIAPLATTIFGVVSELFLKLFFPSYEARMTMSTGQGHCTRTASPSCTSYSLHSCSLYTRHLCGGHLATVHSSLYNQWRAGEVVGAMPVRSSNASSSLQH